MADPPFFDAREHEVQYHGPGREDPIPARLEAIHLGWFGPSADDAGTSIDMFRAAEMALEDANHSGGYEGLPFQLIPAWSADPWGTGVRAVTRLVYDDQVWALIGGPDGATTHLAEQVVAKARLPLISAVATEGSANLTNVAWIFSLAPSDSRIAEALADAIVRQPNSSELSIVSAIDHDARALSRCLMRALAARKMYPSLHVQIQSQAGDVRGQLQRLTGLRGPIIVIADPIDSANLLMELRTLVANRSVFGGPSFGTRQFLNMVGEAGEGVVFPLLWHRDVTSSAVRFSNKFRERHGTDPDYLAAFAYDATTLLTNAIRRSGPNRAAICDAIRSLSPIDGVSGRITWDSTGRNESASVSLATIDDGRIQPAR